jgi:hypothetical protein
MLPYYYIDMNYPINMPYLSGRKKGKEEKLN